MQFIETLFKLSKYNVRIIIIIIIIIIIDIYF